MQPAAKMASLAQRSDAWSWWNDLGNPQKVLAPMVGASERAFRMLCRRPRLRPSGDTHDSRAAVRRVRQAEKGRFEGLEGSTEAGDRLLLAQLCGDDKDVLLECASSLPALRRWD